LPIEVEKVSCQFRREMVVLGSGFEGYDAQPRAECERVYETKHWFDVVAVVEGVMIPRQSPEAKVLENMLYTGKMALATARENLGCCDSTPVQEKVLLIHTRYNRGVVRGISLVLYDCYDVVAVLEMGLLSCSCCVVLAVLERELVIHHIEKYNCCFVMAGPGKPLQIHRIWNCNYCFGVEVLGR
jgi:hypothetical protein